MAFVRLTFLLLFCALTFLGTFAIEENRADIDPYVLAILTHLNNKENKVYNYKQARILNTVQKRDITEVTLDVDVDCLNIYPNLPCTDTSLYCNGYVLNNADTTLEVLNVECKSKPHISVESVDEEVPYVPPPYDRDQKIELSHETVSSESGEPFLAVRRDQNKCCGFPVDLNVNAEGVDLLVDTALRQIEADRDKRHALVKILRLQQQIDSSVKFFLLFEIVPTVCEKDAELSRVCPVDETAPTVTCRVEFIQKPWITKDKHIVGNNCTKQHEFPLPQFLQGSRNDMDNDINSDGIRGSTPSYKPRKKSPNYDAIAETGDMGFDRLADLESQILVDQDISNIQKPKPSADEDLGIIPATEQNIKPLNQQQDYTPHNKYLEIPTMNQGNFQHIPTVTVQPIEDNVNTVQPTSENFQENLAQTQYLQPPINVETQQHQYPPFEDAVYPTRYSDSHLDPIEYHNLHQVQEPINNWNNPPLTTALDPMYDYDGVREEIQQKSVKLDPNSGLRTVFPPYVPDYAPDFYNHHIPKNVPRFQDDIIYYQPEDFLEGILLDQPAVDNPEEVTSILPEQPDTTDINKVAQTTTEKNKTNKSSDENKNSSEDSNEASEKKDSSEEQIKKRSVPDNGVKCQLKQDEDSSSSSSSSSSEENDENSIKKIDDDDNDDNNISNTKNCKYLQYNKKNNKDEDSSSSSSSESDEDDNDNNNDNRKSRKRRHVGQMEKISIHEKPLVRDLADYAAQTLDNIDDDNHKRVVLQILGAKKLKLDGVYYSLILRLGISRCLEDKHPESGEDCREKLFENLTKICKVQVHVDSEFGNPKIVKSQCQNIKKDKYDNNRTNYSRFRRDTRRVPGGRNEVSVDDPEVQESLVRGLKHLDSQTTHTNRLKVKKILSATRQVVAGTIHRVRAEVVVSDCPKTDPEGQNCGDLNIKEGKVCEFKVWSQPWLNHTETTITCEKDEKTYKFVEHGDQVVSDITKNRRKRHLLNEYDNRLRRSTGRIPGGISEASPDDPKIQEFLVRGLQHLDSQSTHANRLKVKKILSTTKQVVAGMLYRVQAEVVVSDCPKTDPEGENCGDLNIKDGKVCEFKIWSQSWLHRAETTITCEKDEKTYKFVEQGNKDSDSDNSTNNRTKRSLSYKFDNNRLKRSTGGIPGGINEASPDDPKIKEYLVRGLQHLDSQSTHENRLKVKKILSTTQQVVAGALYRVRAEVVVSDCPKTDPDGENCGDLNIKEGKICEFKVWSQQWLNRAETTITCEKDEKTYKFVEQGNKNSDSDNSTNNRSKRSLSYKYDNNRINYNRFRRSTGVIKGGIREASPDNPEIKEYLVRGLQHLDSQSTHTNRLKIKKILSTTQQVVSGALYRVRAEVVVSDCPKTDPDGENCGDLNIKEGQICEFKVWSQPWLDRAETTITCEKDEKTYKFVKQGNENLDSDNSTSNRSKRSLSYKDDNSRINYNRFRRSTVGIPGGINEASPDDPKIQEYLVRGLQHLDSQSTHENRLKIKKILSTTQQVVAGALYRVRAEVVVSDCPKTEPDGENCGDLNIKEGKICEFKVWSQPWLNRAETTITCENDEKTYKFVEGGNKNSDSDNSANKRTKRYLYMAPVKQSKQSVNSTKAWNYLEQALKQMDTETLHKQKLKILKVHSINKQLVSGESWTINASVVLSDCLKTEEKSGNQCATLSDDSYLCIFKIWDKSWLPNGTNIKVKCPNDEVIINHKIRRRFGMPDGDDLKSLLPSIKWESQEVANAGAEFFNMRFNQQKQIIVHEISKIKRRVWDEQWAQLLEIEVVYAESNCPKYSKPEECRVSEGGKKMTCRLNLWEHPWLKVNGPYINMTCEDDESEFSFPSSMHYSQLSQDLKHRIFKEYLNAHDMSYSGSEYDLRLNVFKNNLEKIENFNKLEQGTAWYDITKFAHMTEEEFSRSHGYRPDLRHENELPVPKSKKLYNTPPVEFDWRSKGAVTKVKDQGSCGSCWAFSVTGNVEGQYAIAHGQLLEFSEQELVDCDKIDEGCNGGLMDNAYRAIEKLGGLELEGEYPYEAEDEKCHFDKSKVRVKLSGAVNVSHDETEMAQWLVKNGPISIAINANAMQFYVGGVSHPWKVLCSPESLDHGVLIVGYGVHKYSLFNKTLPYWTVKNSWGPSWGEQGYYRVYRGDGTCGLNQTPSSAIVL